MARILIIHQNFPGQYKHLAPALVRAGHEVRATVLNTPTRWVEGWPTHWHGVALWPYDLDRRPMAGQHPWLSDLETKVLRGQACFRALQDMRAQGFEPDVVLAHLGWGEALFVKDVWPKARLGVYGEFFYQTQGSDVGFDAEFSQPSDEGLCKLRLRNANQLLHLHAADAVLAPTHWQASTFPAEYRSRMAVIHDGIDTQALSGDPRAVVQLGSGVQLKAGEEVVTFVSRNLEPYRGYHKFMRALPELLRKRPNAHVLLVGGDQVSYGAAAPQGQSWKQRFINEVRAQISDDDWGRVHFLGRLPYEQYLRVMQVSAVHAYLTYPFVLSWSLLEAMSLGCAIVGSDTAPLREAITHDHTGWLVDFFDASALADAVARLLADPATRQRLGQAARAHVCQHYDLTAVCLPQQMAWVNDLLSERLASAT